jgi:peptidoglycan/LPS O-acetylase OafA/YrhL
LAQRANIPALTGLRGIAILLVVHAHYFQWCAPYSLTAMPSFLLNSGDTASFGMTLFFTLSGWVITYHYWDFGWRERPGAAFARFLFLRLSRLYPALIVFFLINFKRLAIDSSYFGDDWLLPTAANWLSVHTWYPVKLRGVLAHNFGYSINWSISTEIGMYVIFAGGLAVMGWLGICKGRTIAMAAAIYFGLVIGSFYFKGDVGGAFAALPAVDEPLNSSEAWSWFYYLSPYFRFAQFILGGGAAMLIISGWDDRLRPLLNWAAAVAAVSLMVFYLCIVAGVNMSIDKGEIVQSFLFATIMANARADTWLNRMHSSKLLVFFGLISYSLYLFQMFPTFFGGGSQSGQFTWALYPKFLYNFALSLLFASVMAWGFYHLVEMPGQKWLRGLWVRRRYAFAMGGPAVPVTSELRLSEIVDTARAQGGAER